MGVPPVAGGCASCLEARRPCGDDDGASSDAIPILQERPELQGWVLRANLMQPFLESSR